jgi:hypothetical protein
LLWEIIHTIALALTGAGRGIGREIALLAAAEGARVVVKDLGGAADGEGASSGPANEVAGEIRTRGGTAVANFDSVAEPASANNIVKSALENFGRLDGVVKPTLLLRYTRLMFTEYLKKRMQDLLGYGLAMEGLALMEQIDPPQ